MITNTTELLQVGQQHYPLTDLSEYNICVITSNPQHFAPLIQQLSRYHTIEQHQNDEALNKDTPLVDIVLSRLTTTTNTNNNTFIIAGTTEEITAIYTNTDLLTNLATTDYNILLVAFGPTPPAAPCPDVYTLLFSPQDAPLNQQHAAQSLFNGMPVVLSPNPCAPNTTTTTTYPQTRLHYPNHNNTTDEQTFPGYDITALAKDIDALLYDAMYITKSTPSGVVMVIKDNKVLFEKAYGYHEYLTPQQEALLSKSTTTTTTTTSPQSFFSTDLTAYIEAQSTTTRATQLDDIYDLASLTKIIATTPSIMTLVESQQINVDHTMGSYLPAAETSNKRDIPLRTILMHEAGFIPYIKFFENCTWGKELSPFPTAAHTVQVAAGCWIVKDYYYNHMWPTMLHSPLLPDYIGKYLYSDLSMYIMKEIVEQLTAKPFEQFVLNNLFKPLGMKDTNYLPFQHIPTLSRALERIVPTEIGDFRKCLIQGFCHDEGCSMAGGVAGHAGLFGTANDIAVYAQMLLNKGQYGGKQFYKAETVEAFTTRQTTTSRRGLGFDRWDHIRTTGYPSSLANYTVFGHTGFTGTCLFVDPMHQLAFIFLSNRVHPDRSGRFLENNYRARIFDRIYQCIGVTEEPQPPEQQ